MVKRITKQEKADIAAQINAIYSDRKKNTHRLEHEPRWREVDRQVRMNAIPKADEDKWQANIELGELSRASEIISADVRRILFPAARRWFDPHSKLDFPQLQEKVDDRLRDFMAQQHADFGLLSRIDLSIKEVLHHGGFVATMETRTQARFDGARVETITAPVWIPHSMWDCFPDDSRHVVTSDTFYPGSMVIREKKPWHVIQKMGFAPKLNKEPNDVVEMIHYYGNLAYKKRFFANFHFVVVEDHLAFAEQNKTPVSPVIYGGYERIDVKDPYFVSPLVKLSPTQKFATDMANLTMDSLHLKVKPPITYDSNDPDFALNGGPKMFPGANSGSKTMGAIKVNDIGDPSSGLAAAQFGIRQLQEGTGVDSIRAGVTASSRRTATEINQVQQGSEIRTVGLVDKMEAGLRTMLYLQHMLNKKELTSYSYYSTSDNSPDFLEVLKEDLPEQVHFEVVGSKTVLGEERRAQQTAQVTAFLMQNPITAQKLDYDNIARDMYANAGVKNPEKFLLSNPTQSNQLQAENQKLQKVAQELQNAASALQEELSKVADEVQKQDQEINDLKTRNNILKIQLEEKDLERARDAVGRAVGEGRLQNVG